MSTLTDRYVWAVLRAVPAGKRRDLEPEIRALVLDTADAHVDAGSPEAAERAALLELGDPDVLAGRYVDRTRFLIGPRFYTEWQRLLSILVSIVVPIITIVVGATRWYSGAPIGDVILASIGAGFGVAVQIVFWVTVGFATAERTAGREYEPAREWTPDQLPAVPATERMGPADVIATIVANVFVILAIVWVQTSSPIVIEGTSYPLFDPALWSFWLPYFIVIAGLEIVFSIALYLRGRWTWGMAVVNAALAAAFAIPALWLLQNGLLFNPALVDRIVEETSQVADGAWFLPSVAITGIVIAAITAWDAFDGFRKAYHNSRPAPLATASV
jgi:hypothetical protein